MWSACHQAHVVGNYQDLDQLRPASSLKSLDRDLMLARDHLPLQVLSVLIGRINHQTVRERKPNYIEQAEKHELKLK